MTTGAFPRLFEPFTLGDLALKNRIVMPPMTRSRASQPGDVANELMAEYYAQRASAAFIVSEGTQISPLGKGYAWTPGIYSQAQIAGWRKVTSAVHDKGGILFAQLWHVGRVSHPDNIGGNQPVSSSAIRAEGVKVFVDNGSDAPGFVETAQPRELSREEIRAIVGEFHQAALNAKEAGFDGVELHAANGYLINQFIDSESNARTDEYGGSLENRLRFLDEVVGALVDAVGANRVGVRLAPLTTLNGTVDADPHTTYVAAARVLNGHKVAYMHIAEADWEDAPDMPMDFKRQLRDVFAGAIIYAGKYTPERADQALASGVADLVAFGRPFVANPDLPYRIRHKLDWSKHDPDTLFGGAEKGLTDYPTALQQAARQSDAPIFSALDVGSIRVGNRVAMAPMTRARADQPGDVPNGLMAEYYAQRASAGLIITEGTPISAVGRGYSMTPGIYTEAQVAGWRGVTQAVHAKGGSIVTQLWHVGRRSHRSIAGETPVSASALKNPDKVYGPLPEGGFGMIETDVPREMTVDDIRRTIADFVQAAKNAMDAGFDGVELHGAHGYLLDQFLRATSNRRTDAYGGSQVNRIRFVVEVVEAVAAAIGADKLGIRLSPHVTEGFAEVDPEIEETTLLLLSRLAPLGLAYVHLSENISNAQRVPDAFRRRVREVFPGKIIVAGKLDHATANSLLASGNVDLVGFGQPFITNPDFVERLRNGYPIAPVDYAAHATFYGGGAEGYTDYPRYTA